MRCNAPSAHGIWIESRDIIPSGLSFLPYYYYLCSHMVMTVQWRTPTWDLYHYHMYKPSWSNAPGFAPRIPLSQSRQPHRGPRCRVPLALHVPPLSPSHPHTPVLSCPSCHRQSYLSFPTPPHALLQPCATGPTLPSSHWSVRSACQHPRVASHFIIVWKIHAPYENKSPRYCPTLMVL